MKQLFRSHIAMVMFSLVSIVAVIAVVLCIYMYGQYRTAQILLEKSAAGSTEEILSLIQSIGVFMELPSGETPTLATVTDIAKLPAIPFFSRAMVGDKVLIYQKAAKALLYRPSTKKIIDTSVFTSPELVNTPTVPAKKEQITIELRNGTPKTGITADFEKRIQDVAPTTRIVAKNSARKRDYIDSMVIPKNASFSNSASELAKTLDIAVGSLPSGEASMSADIVIILGSDAVGLK